LISASLDNLDTITSWTDIAHYTSLAGRLQVLASDQDPALSEAFNRDQYTAVTDLLRRYFSVLITDSGTGLVHSAMDGALHTADTLIIAAAPTLDGASRSAKTLDWLVAHDHAHLVERAVVALSHDRSSRWVDSGPIHDYFTRRCHAVIDIPPDPHLTIGGPIYLDELRTRTRDAFLQLAAHVAEQFTPTPPRAPHPDHTSNRQERK
jgi:MinD-like ATPase involved in chromosome partitioning or flagellar assembly